MTGFAEKEEIVDIAEIGAGPQTAEDEVIERIEVDDSEEFRGLVAQG